jgi:phosphoglycerate dehydrogenase-like enzyme
MNAHRTLIVTSRPPVHRDLLLEAAPDGLEITMLVSPSSDELYDAVRSIQPVFLVSERTGKIDRRTIEAGRSLRLIQRLGRQIHDIDLEAAREAGIAVCNWPLPQLSMVAEHVMMQILSLLKRGRPATAVVVEASDRWGPPQHCDANTFAINWSGFTGVRQLADATVGIIGFGEIGTNLAGLLRPYDTSVLYNRRTRLPGWAEDDLGIAYATVEEIQTRSDIIVLLLPHSPETEGSIDSQFVERMQPGSFLVSSGASTLLDEEAVADAYRSGHLAGVATDGFRWEPVRPIDPLVTLAVEPSNNIILTPHSAQADLVLDADLRRHEFTNLQAMANDEPLRHIVEATR